MTTSLARNFNRIISNNDASITANLLRDDMSIREGFSGSECYSVYRAATQDNHKTTADVVVPYIANAIADLHSVVILVLILVAQLH